MREIDAFLSVFFRIKKKKLTQASAFNTILSDNVQEGSLCLDELSPQADTRVESNDAVVAKTFGAGPDEASVIKMDNAMILSRSHNPEEGYILDTWPEHDSAEYVEMNGIPTRAGATLICRRVLRDRSIKGKIAFKQRPDDNYVSVTIYDGRVIDTNTSRCWDPYADASRRELRLVGDGVHVAPCLARLVVADRFYSVSPFYSRSNLRTILKNSPGAVIEEQKAKAILTQIIGIIEHLQNFNICHQNLRTESFSIRDDGSIILTRLAYYRKGIHWHNGFSPDIFNLGLILHELLFGFPLFAFPNPEDRNYATRIIDHNSLEGLADQTQHVGVSALALDLIGKMLNPSPANRITLAQVKGHPWLRA